MQPRRRQRFCVGGLSLQFENCDRRDETEALAAFATTSRSRPASRLAVLDEPARPSRGAALVGQFGTWALFDRTAGPRFEAYAPPLYGARPLMQADLRRDWSAGILRMDPDVCPARMRQAPLATVFGEQLLIALLGRRGGLYVHAATVVDHGRALVLLGKSGAGKSTLSGLASERGMTVLSDDRTVLRLRRRQLWAFGTPFHGTGHRWAATQAPVGALLFIEHAPENRLDRLSETAATARLASLCFAPYWSKPGIETMLEGCERAARAAPAFRFGFPPDATALEALLAATAPTRQARTRP